MNTDDRQQHIDTLARALHDHEHPGACDCDAKGIGGPWSEDAAAIFDSTDPAVHDALTAALHANADRARILAAHSTDDLVAELRRRGWKPKIRVRHLRPWDEEPVP